MQELTLAAGDELEEANAGPEEVALAVSSRDIAKRGTIEAREALAESFK